MHRFVAAGIASVGGAPLCMGGVLNLPPAALAAFGHTWLTWCANVQSARAFRVRSTTEQQ